MESRVGKLKNPDGDGTGTLKFFTIVGVISAIIWLMGMFLNDPQVIAALKLLK
jgi:hypothetical protein